MIPKLLLLLPIASMLVILLGTRRSSTVSALVSTLSAAACFVLSLGLLGHADEIVHLIKWFHLGDSLKFDINLQIDRLSRGMMFVVSLVGVLVHVFSLGYMKDDPGKSRYFACLSLFMFSMTGIVLADSFVMMFIFWELVGVSSFLLIGHWYEKDSAADAAKKAFLTNRIGDFGFMVGIMILFGITGAVTFAGVQEGLASTPVSAGLLTAAALCVFAGAVGKSAQLPLHVWLPDAMEGPTPVSALIHAATMVAAGVYMLARSAFLLEASPMAGNVVAAIGAVTALAAALMALQQDDIKRILAYSTLSQLGYMVMAVGVGAPEAGMFHLYTHAFFKALLFLGAGALIHACHHEQNIWKMGGLKSRMPITFWTFLIGTGALCALPFFTSGFFSKELILEAALHRHWALFLVAVSVAFLTAFYMTRLVVVTFLGAPRSEHADNAKEVDPVMFVPLIVLAVMAVIAGFPFVASRLAPMEVHPHFFPHSGIGWTAFLASVITLVAGVGLAFVRYLDRKEEPKRVEVLANKFYIDEAYGTLVEYGQDRLAWLVKGLDGTLIGGVAVGGAAALVSGVGSLLRRIHLGNLQGYSFLFGFGVFALIYLVVFYL